MAGNTKRKPTKLANILLVVVIAFVALAIFGFFDPATVQNIEIVYGPGAEAKARELGKADNTVISDTQLYRRKMSEFEEFKNDASARIDYTYGYLYVADIEKLSSTKIRITLNCRTAVAVVDGAIDAVVNEDGYVLERRTEKKDDGLVRISGVDQKTPRLGWLLELNGSDENLLKNAIGVAKVITENGYQSVFAEISMMKDGEVMLSAVVGSSKVPVYINLHYDVLHSIDIAYSMLNKGVTSGGKITVTGEKGYFSPDAGTTTTKGM